MLRRFQCWLLVPLLLSVAGCGQPASTATPSAAKSEVPTLNPNGYLNIAQPKLPTLKLYVGPKEIRAEIASKDVEIRTGMMHRTELGENDGMLFVFPGAFRAAFYMRNTKVPLTGAYIDPDGVVLELHDMKPLDESSIEAATDRVQYVLEMNRGWFQKNGIGVGAVVTTERGKLGSTFFGR